MRIIIGLILLTFLSSGSRAQSVPGTISYQGILLQNDGITPLADGAHSIVFKFYNVPSGGSALAGLDRTVSVTTSKGLFTCVIGGGSAPNAPFSAANMNTIGSQQVYIGISVDGGAELSPRAQLTSSTYAYRAESVSSPNNPQSGQISFWGANNTLNNDGNLFWDNTNKRIGLGITTPGKRIHILSTNEDNNDIGIEAVGSTSPGVIFYRAQGTVDAKTATLVNNALGVLQFAGYTGSTYSTAANISSNASTDFSTGVNGLLAFRTALSGSLLERMRITHEGNIGIGTTLPSEKLSINGGVTIDHGNTNAGNTTNSLRFGGAGSGEAIASKRTAGGNQFGLDFFTNSSARLSITNAGNVGIGTTSPNTNTRLDIRGTNLIAQFRAPFPSIVGGTNNGGALYFGMDATSSTNPTAAIETSWGGATNPQLGIGVVRDGLKANILLDYGGNTSIKSANNSIAYFGGNGNVGIGFVAPSYRLEVLGNSTGTAYFYNMASTSATVYGIRAETYAGSGAGTRYGIYSAAGSGTTNYGIYATAGGGGTNWAGYFSAGNVHIKNNLGIGTELPDQKLSVSGNASKTGGGSWATFSDARLKKNIQPFNDGLNCLLNINPIRFSYNGLADYPDDGKEYIGIIAQDIQKIAPFMISIVSKKLRETDVETTDLLMYDPSSLDYVIINAIKEQQSQIEDLKSKNLQLEQRLIAIERLLLKQQSSSLASSKTEE
jgi:hypothetical protein